MTGINTFLLKKVPRAGGLIVAVCAFFLLAAISISAQQSGSIRGKVMDSVGALIVGATATAVNEGGTQKTAQANAEGAFVISNLAAGKYTLRVNAPGFAVYENPEVLVEPGKSTSL